MEIAWFFYHSDLCEIKIVDSRSAKSAILTQHILTEAPTIDFSWILAFSEGWKLLNWQNPVPLKLQNGSFGNSTIYIFPNLVSRKIWMTEKSWNFYNVLVTGKLDHFSKIHIILVILKGISFSRSLVMGNYVMVEQMHNRSR